MSTLLSFLKATLFAGFFVLFPLLLFYLLLSEIFAAVVGLATPIADLLPPGIVDEVKSPVVIAVLLIVVASFLLGLAGRLPLAKHIALWIERHTLGRLPLYDVVKSLTSRFGALERDARFKPALLHGHGEQRELAFLIEDLGDGFATVMLPRSPTPMAGSLKVVPIKQVELLDISLGDFTAVISHWGVGSSRILTNREH